MKGFIIQDIPGAASGLSCCQTRFALHCMLLLPQLILFCSAVATCPPDATDYTLTSCL